MKGFGHVDFDSAEAVQNAIKKHGMDFEGRELKVDASNAKSGGGSRGGYGGGNRGGYGGGRGGRGGRPQGDPMQRAQKSGAIINSGGNNVKALNSDSD